MTWCKDKTMSQRRIMVVPMALRLCQGVERDCFVHNSTTTWTRLGSAFACRHFSFFLFIRFSTFSLSCSCRCVHSVYIRSEASMQSLQRWQLWPWHPKRGEAANQKEKNLGPINGPRQWTGDAQASAAGARKEGNP